MKPLLLFAFFLFVGCSSMNTDHICLDCSALKALADNDYPDQLSKTHACWFDKYDFSKDKEGKYCIYWDSTGKIVQYGFEQFENDETIFLIAY